ncbi:MAG: DNA repair protein RecN [Acidobacteriota bacterium]
MDKGRGHRAREVIRAASISYRIFKMLSLLKINNIALIDRLEIELGPGLNLLTGETGSGKSIIVDSLSALTGERTSSDIIKEGERSAVIEGLFSIEKNGQMAEMLHESGIELDADDDELIVRRELSATGRNRAFVNNQLVTQGFLKKIGPLLVDIHGQGEAAALYDPASHLEMLDRFARNEEDKQRTADAFSRWSSTLSELAALKQDESDKLQLIDILRFQADEIRNAAFIPGENESLEEEKRRLSNVEKLLALSSEAYDFFYDNDESTVATIEKGLRRIEELAEYDSMFRDYLEPIRNAQAVLEDLAISTRDFRNGLEYSPARLEEIENRLAEIARIARKYGGTIHSALDHLADAQNRLENIETAEFREAELQKDLAAHRSAYLDAAMELHKIRVKAAAKFEKEVENELGSVALEKARFMVRIDRPDDDELKDQTFKTGFSSKGIDRVEFYFSANPGESPKALAKVASGGEASRLMLVLKTTAGGNSHKTSAVFDEIDAGIGGRVAEAVGRRLKRLASSQQVMCVTHQPQIASQADRHFVVSKTVSNGRAHIGIDELDDNQRVEEIARMLAGERITNAARENAREMLKNSADDGRKDVKARKMRS